MNTVFVTVDTSAKSDGKMDWGVGRVFVNTASVAHSAMIAVAEVVAHFACTASRVQNAVMSVAEVVPYIAFTARRAKSAVILVVGVVLPSAYTI